MLLSQKLADFTKGEADLLRKAMGKKDRKTLDKIKPQFIEKAKSKGFDIKIIEKIWSDWEAFASYAFNKSHSTGYAYVAFQTAYLKAHYPAEFMAAVLNSASNIEKITFFIDECKRMGLQVLGPDINESFVNFTVTKKGDIRFGLSAIKGIGEGVVSSIIDERIKNGAFKDVYDFFERINLSVINRKAIDNLVIAGAFDTFGIERSQYFNTDAQTSFIEQLIKYGNRFQNEKNTSHQSLWQSAEISIAKPIPTQNEQWSLYEKLNKEKDLVGLYLSAHPLDPYKFDIEYICTHKLTDLSDLSAFVGKDVTVAGIVTESRSGITKNNKPYGAYTIEDISGTFKFNLFGKDYTEFERMLKKDWLILIKGHVQTKTFGNNEPELKINKIFLLSEAREELINSLILRVPVNEINNDFIDDLYNRIVPYKGNTILKFIVFDEMEEIKVEFISRKYRIKISDDFINFIHSNPFIQIKVA